MGSYVRSIEISEPFDGDTLVIRLKPITSLDAQKIRAALAGEKDEAFSKVISEVLPPYIESFSGLRTADGTEITSEEFLSKLYFVRPAVAVTLKWMRAGSPKAITSSAESPEGSQPA